MLPTESGVTVRRRNLLSTAAGATGVAGCLGGEAKTTATQPAETGTRARTDPTPRAKHGSGVDLQAVQAAADGKVVPATKGVGLGDAIDPASTETPIQDAIDLINEGREGKSRGFVFVPPENITEAEPITDLSAIQIRGFGKSASKIRFPNGTDGIQLTPEDSFCGLKHLQLEGPGTGESGTAIHILDESGAVREFNIDEITLVKWQSDAPVIHTESKYYASQWGKVKIWGCDGTLCKFDTMGPANTWNVAALNGGPNTDHLIEGTWRGRIQVINNGGIGREANGPYFDFKSGTSGCIGWVNCEVHNDHEPRQSVFRFSGNASLDIDHVELKAKSVVDYVVDINGAGGYGTIGRVTAPGSGEVRESVIGVTKDIRFPVIYKAESRRVENLTGSSLSAPVVCLGDLSLVT